MVGVPLAGTHRRQVKKGRAKGKEVTIIDFCEKIDVKPKNLLTQE
jgi:translation initiation factor 1 (eIF-1/SUI1)